MGRLQGKVAIITGSGSGMGRAAARLFAREGAKVVVADLDTTSGQETTKLIRDVGGDATFVKVDVCNVDDLKNMVKVAVDNYGKLNILYNHAGIPGPGGLDVEVADWDKGMALNVRSGFFATKYAVPELKKSGGGSIIFTSSIAGLVGSMMSPFYSASKGGVSVMAMSLALLLASDKIRVNVICPGPVDTPMLPKFFARGAVVADPKVIREGVMASVPLGRPAQPEEIANAALFLASDESSFITGVNLPVDGGFVAK